MIDQVGSVPRVQYSININTPKSDSGALTNKDCLEIGYMAGRYGINLGTNPQEANQIKYNKDLITVDINACTSDLFEQNLKQAGIKFNRLA